LFGRFTRELRQNGRLLGGAIGDSERVIFPPATYCDDTYAAVTHLVPVGPLGTIRASTRVCALFSNGPTPPYTIVYVQLDNASTAAPGYLRDDGVTEATGSGLVGRRCRAVIKPNPQGTLADIVYELLETQA